MTYFVLEIFIIFIFRWPILVTSLKNFSFTIPDKMDKITDVKFEPLTESRFMKPVRMRFKQVNRRIFHFIRRNLQKKYFQLISEK